MLGTPVFNSKEAAMQAEGLLARMLEARGHRTKSDAKNKAALRRQLHRLRMQTGRYLPTPGAD